MNYEIGQKFFQQVMDILINPEIERRKKFGKNNKTFCLFKAQIIFSLYKGWNEVRLNNEVKAIAKCKTNKPKRFC